MIQEEVAKQLDTKFKDYINTVKERKDVAQKEFENYNPSKIFLITAGVISIISLIIVFFPSNQFELTSHTDFNKIYLFAIIGLILATSGIVYFLAKNFLQDKLHNLDYQLIKLGAEELQEDIEENFFTKLVKINFKYLDQYYLQTQEQAKRSFWLASFASITGLIIVTVGITMMFLNKTEPAYVTTGAGLISEFIAAVFFYLYNQTVLKMSQYHQKLVITQNISLALKISEDMDNETKNKTQEMIVDRLTNDINKYLSE